jgi:hypothetical protein
METTMAHFHGLLMYLSPGSSPDDRVVRSSDLSYTSIVPVPDLETALEVVRSFDRLDLIELYGGFGPTAAAAILELTGNGEVPVGLVGAEYPTPPTKLAAIFEAPGADPAVHRWTNGSVTIVAVPSAAAAPAVAAQLAAEGVDRIEVCGGMGAVPAAAVQAAVDVPVSTVLFGFESMPTVAAYRARFEQTLKEHPDLITGAVEIL